MPNSLAKRLPTAALAFRGYNQANLGRTADLLAVAAYRPFVLARLEEAGHLCSEATGRSVDLPTAVAAGVEPGLDRYAESIALIFAAELAQIDLLREVHGVEARDAKLAFGYSLGELTAISMSGIYPLEAVMRVPLELAADCAAMAPEVTMTVAFSRRVAISEPALVRACEEVTAQGRGAVAVSAVLSPNTLLVLGQGDSIQRLEQHWRAIDGPDVLFRKNDGLWPPLHTPLVREKHIPDRAALMIREAPRLTETPRPPVWSLVTGTREYEDDSGREVLRQWVDSPQRLWDVVEGLLSSDIRTLIHVGPAPNVIPATFRRLAENVVRQTVAWSISGVGMRTVQQMAGSPWLAPLLPRSGCLLRAPTVQHVILEDWLLEHAPE